MAWRWARWLWRPRGSRFDPILLEGRRSEQVFEAGAGMRFCVPGRYRDDAPRHGAHLAHSRRSVEQRPLQVDVLLHRRGASPATQAQFCHLTVSPSRAQKGHRRGQKEHG